MLKVVSKLRTYFSLIYQLTDSIKGILALFFLFLLSIQAFAQNPVIEGTRTHVNNSETSNHTISLPSDIQVGDLILVLLEFEVQEILTRQLRDGHDWYMKIIVVGRWFIGNQRQVPLNLFLLDYLVAQELQLFLTESPIGIQQKHLRLR